MEHHQVLMEMVVELEEQLNFQQQSQVMELVLLGTKEYQEQPVDRLCITILKTTHITTLQQVVYFNGKKITINTNKIVK
jgi:hypothetical protein